MQIRNTEGQKPLHIFFITHQNVRRCFETNEVFINYKPVGLKILRYESKYIIPIKAFRLGEDGLSKCLNHMSDLHRVGYNKFYAVEATVPDNMDIGNDDVFIPYLVKAWVQGVHEVSCIRDANNIRFNLEYILETDKSTFNGVTLLDFSDEVLERLLSNWDKATSIEEVYEYNIDNRDLLSALVSSISDDDSEVINAVSLDLQSVQFPAFEGPNIVNNGVWLSSYKIMWERIYGKDIVAHDRCEIDPDNLEEEVKLADKILTRKEKYEARKAEKERIKEEKRRIAEKKRYYGINADKVDDRVKMDQNSVGWWSRWVANKVTFGLVRPPKTMRSDDYRKNFIKRNPGLFIEGLYFCIYCGKPIHADSSDQNRKMYVDHIKPINQGGRNSTWNLGPACWKCNSNKSDKGGEWVVLGYMGKLGFTTMQVVSNVSKTLLFGYKEKNKFKKAVSIGFYVYTGLWMFKLFL